MTQAQRPLFDICIRGGGIVGRTLALLLARTHLRIALVDAELASPSASSRKADVRAYALNAKSRSLLESLRCWPAPQHATEITTMCVKGDDGGSVSFSAEQLKVQGLTWIADVPALEARLAEAVRFQPRIDVVAQAQSAQLTVVCEGRASASRDEFGVDFDIAPYPQHAIATRLQCELPHAQVAYQWFTQGEILAFLPLDGVGGNSVAVVWSVPQARAQALLALPGEAFCNLLQEASHGQLGTLTLGGERAAWPLQNAKARQWCGQHQGQAWVLAGDAAHNVHPLAGQGLNLGLGDVHELANLLTTRDYWRAVNDDKLLRRYERARKTALLGAMPVMDGLQQLFSQSGAPWQTLRNWGMNGFERSGPLKNWVARQAMGL